MLRNLWTDECGAIISAELALVLTIAVLAMVVGLSEIAVAVNTELNDISNAIGALNQSYGFTGFHHTEGVGVGAKPIAFYNGSSWADTGDDCDHDTSCALVCTIPPTPTVCNQ